MAIDRRVWRRIVPEGEIARIKENDAEREEKLGEAWGEGNEPMAGFARNHRCCEVCLYIRIFEKEFHRGMVGRATRVGIFLAILR